MTRSVKEWIGKTSDTKIPDHVKVRVYLAYGGCCPKCSRALWRGNWDTDHIVALINGGQNRESNLQPLCASPCHSNKTKADVAEKARVARKRSADLLPKKSKLRGRGFGKAPPQRKASTPIEKWKGF